jgi:hypothetical protein
VLDVGSDQAVAWLHNAFELYPFEKQRIPITSELDVRAIIRSNIYAQLPVMERLATDSSTCWTILRPGDCEHVRQWRLLINDNCLVTRYQHIRAQCCASSLQELIRRRCLLMMSTSYSALVQATAVKVMAILFVIEY